MIRSTLENPRKRRRSWQADATPPRRVRVACQFQGNLKSPLKAFAAFLREKGLRHLSTAAWLHAKEVTLLWNITLVYMLLWGQSLVPPRSPGHGPQLHECEALPNLGGVGLNYKGVQFQTQLETKQECPND